MSRALQTRRAGVVAAPASAPELVAPEQVAKVRPHRSAMTVMRGGSRVLAMIAVVFAFTASVAAVVPNAQAYEAIALGGQTAQGDVQAMAPVDGEVPDPAISRDGYTVTAAPPPPPPPPPAPARVVSSFASPIQMSLTPSSSSASLQWPVPAGTPMSSAFGPRSCSGCSSFHQGVDLNAAAGTPIWSMAAGVVLPPLGSGYSSYGVHVRIQSVVNGEMVETLYAHMQSGSVQVATGQTVAAGQVIGAMGCTGSCSGTHLHFEIHPGGGAPVDPVAWMRARLG